MDNWKTNLTRDNYKKPSPKYWTGRSSKENKEPEYWHQIINLVDLSQEEIMPKEDNTNIALLSYACDQGVQRNQGRIGAKKAPKYFRKQLAKLPIHFNHTHIVDFGNITCKDGNMENTQQLLQQSITAFLNKGFFPIVIGGGHDIAYGHYNGIRDFLIAKNKKRICIVNFDAHFDLRPMEGIWHFWYSFLSD